MRFYINRLIEKISERPLIIPALTCFLSVFLIYRSGLIFAAVAVLLLIIIFYFLSRENKGNTKFCLVLSTILSLYIIVNLYSAGFGVSDRTIIEPDTKSNNYIFTVTDLDINLDGTCKYTLYNPDYGKAIWRIPYSETLPSIGSAIEVSGRMTLPDKPRNPGEFDYSEYLSRQGINYVVREESGNNGSFRYINVPFYSDFLMRGRILIYKTQQYVTGMFDNPDMAAAMFMGDTSLVDDDVRETFALTNCSHLLAVSGTHFAGFLTLLPMLFAMFPLRRRTNLTLYTVFCLLICFMTGWTESVTRAAIMSICAFGSRDTISGLSLAAIVIAISNPLSLLSMSFLLSFVICASIKLFSEPVTDKLAGIGINRKIASSVAVIIASQLGLVPFWSSMNTRISIVLFAVQFIASLLAQIGCVFFVPSVILAAFISLISKSGVYMLTFPCSILLKLIVALVGCFKTTAIGTRAMGNVGALYSWVFLIEIVFFLKMPVNRIFRKASQVISLTCLIVLCSVYVWGKLTNVSKVIFIDVGQGDCCLIISGEHSVLIDGGTYDMGRRVESVLNYYSIVTPEYTIVTHWDQDHCGGIEYLIEQGRVSEVYSSTMDPDERYDVRIINRGDSAALGEDRLLCLSPADSGGNSEDSNEYSVVLEYMAHDTSILFTADIPSEVEEYLVQSDLITDVDIIKVAHHGSRFSTSDLFVNSSDPEIAVIQVGEHNNYGHPSDEVIARLNNHGTQVYDTISCGAVTVEISRCGYDIQPYLSQAITTNDSSE